MKNTKKIKIIYMIEKRVKVEVDRNWTEDDIEDYIMSLEWPQGTIDMNWEEE